MERVLRLPCTYSAGPSHMGARRPTDSYAKHLWLFVFELSLTAGAGQKQASARFVQPNKGQWELE